MRWCPPAWRLSASSTCEYRVGELTHRTCLSHSHVLTRLDAGRELLPVALYDDCSDLPSTLPPHSPLALRPRRLVQECIVPAGARDPVTGVLQPDPVKFPYGLANLTAYIHSKGLKAGVYTDVAHLTCAGYEGSGPAPTNPAGHWALDALTFAQWGFDLIEADFCNTGALNMTAYELYKGASHAITAATAATGRPIVFYMCNWGIEAPWTWFPELANLARNTGDICAPGSIHWDRILSNFDNTVQHSSWPAAAPGLPGTGIGAFNDPDMLGPGLPGISDVEGRSQFSLWCILGAPLFLGTDVRNMTAATLATLSNKEAVAINQDALGVQGYAMGPKTAPVPYNGGYMLNLTAPAAQGAPPAPGTTWSFDATTGRLSNSDTGSCVTGFSCADTPNSTVFVYDCITNQCGNEQWRYNSTSGEVVTQVSPSPPQPLCLTGVDASTAPFSTAVLDVCDGRATQRWSLGSDGTLCLPPAAFPSPSTCLAQIVPPSVNVYVKPLAPSVAANGRVSQGIALAVLNRGPATVPGQTIDLTAFSFGPMTAVMVRDIWDGSTSGPYTGSFVTRAVDSHETLLLRLYLA